MELIEITNEAITKLLEKKSQEQFNYIRLGITGGGCAGFEYIFDSVDTQSNEDTLVDYGQIKFLADEGIAPV